MTSTDRSAGSPVAAVGGRYVLEEPIGRGGMAQVFRALDTSTGRRVAFKLLQPRDGQASLARNRELFQLEFHTLVQLAHPRIVSALDYGETSRGDDGQPYYTMELLEGGDLRERSPLPWQEACAVAHDLCSALSLLHSRRMVYRDLSPRNVLRSSDGTAKLIDFGAMAPMGTTQAVVCTPTVASPELVYRQPVDGRSDLYALGATLYFMLVGRTPYPVRTFQELPEQWKQPPPRISELMPEVPPALDALVMELLQLDAQLRPGSAAEVGQRLSAIATLAEAEQLPFSQAYLTTPELVGRDRELASLQAAITRMRRDGRGAGMLLRGARGVGRSRLLDASVLAGKLAGLAVVHVACAALTRGPYALVRAIVNQLLEVVPGETQQAAAVHAPGLDAILPALRASLPEPPRASQPAGDADRGASVALRELVLGVARSKPLLLAIDDVERCDLQSLAVIALLAQEARAQPLLLIASETGADGHPNDGLRMLADACTQLVLPPLDGKQTERLLSSVFGDVPNLSLLVRRLHGVAAGNPQDLLRLCQHLLDRGVLGYRAGSWVLPDRFAAFELPGSMAQAFASTAQALDPDARALGQTFAACPDEAFTLDECVMLCGHGNRLQAFAAIDALLAAGVLVVRDVRYALAAQEWVAALSGGDARAELHARLAQVFLARKDGLRAARHLLAAGSNDQAIDALLAWSMDSYRDTIGSGAAYVALVDSLPQEWMAIFAAAFAQCRVLGRSQHDVYWLERRATTLVGQFDICSDGLHAAFGQRLARCAGLDRYEALDPALPVPERLQRALGGAAAAFAATPERDRVLDPKEAIAELARATISGISSCTRTLDVEEWSQLPSIGALAPLSKAVAVIDLLARGFSARLSGRFEHACEIYTSIMRMLGGGDTGVDPTFRDTILGALPAVIGTIDAVLGRAAAESAAATVERDPLYSGSALAIRLLHRLWQGDLAAADAFARKSELWRLENARQDGADTATVLWILPAHAASDDLTRTRHCLEAMERKSARMRTWQPMASWARAEYERIRGDLTAACSAADDALARLPAGKHPAWPLCAGTRLKVLCAQRRFTEARSDGERDLQLALAAGIGFASIYLRMPLAIACAEVGEREAAFAHARAAIETCEALGASGLMLGLAYECAADVASRCGDSEEHDRYARLCKRFFLAFPNPALAAKYQRLVRAARRARVSSRPAAASQHTQDIELARAQVESLLMTCSERDQRLQRALALLIASSGAEGGVLYTPGERGLQAQAATHEGPMPGEVTALAARLFESTFDTGGQDDTVCDAGTTQTGMWTSAGRRYQPLLLSHREDNRLVITGLVVLCCDAALSDETALVAAELSRMFAARGDLMARAVS